MNKKPKPNMTESVLARAELFRRGMMFAGVPQMSTTELETPALPEMPGAADPGAADPAAPAAPVDPGTTDELVAGALKNESPLEVLAGGA